MSTTVSFAALAISVTIIGIDGLPKAAPVMRPLRKTPTGFGIVMHGKVLPLTCTGAQTGTVTLTDARFERDVCPPAKMADIGKTKKADADKDPKATYAKAPAEEPAKKPRTIPQMRSTVAMCQARAEKAMGSGDEDTIAKALKALETAEGNLAKAIDAEAKAKADAEKAAKPSKKAKAKVADAPKADAAPTKAQVMAELDRLAKLLASMS